MEIHVLGTSSGTPTKDRNVSGVSVVQTDGKSCLSLRKFAAKQPAPTPLLEAYSNEPA